MSSNRIFYIDIAKGTLIILVVIGHFPYNDDLARYIFWFHMPAFFMLSGLFLKEAGDGNIRTMLALKAKRLCIPYFSYSLILGALVQYESFAKCIVRTLGGGGINTTCYSYPYYFINVLFLSICLFYLLKPSWRIYAAILCYVLAHIESVFFADSIPYRGMIPWATDTVLIAFPYLMLGYCAKIFILRIIPCWTYSKVLLMWLLLCLILFGCIWAYGDSHLFNLKSCHYQSFIMDILIPVVCTSLLVILCFFLSRCGKWTWLVRQVRPH